MRNSLLKLDFTFNVMRAGDSIPLGHKTLRVLRIRDNDADQPPVLVVEDAA